VDALHRHGADRVGIEGHQIGVEARTHEPAVGDPERGADAVPVMAAQGFGAIVNIGSIAALRGIGRVAYSAAKGAVHAFTVDMA
jgi:hypothetical protein